MENEFDYLIGKTLAQAEMLVPMIIRVVEVDKARLIATDDYVTNRINVRVADGRIIGIEGIG